MRWLDLSAGAALLLLLVSCSDPKQQHVTATIDGTLVAGSNTCADVTLHFTTRPRPAQSIALATTLGILDTAGSSDDAKRQKTIKTTGEREQVTPICPGLVAGTGVLSGRADDEQQIDEKTFVIAEPTVAALYVDVERSVLRVPDATSTTAHVTLYGSSTGSSTPNVRVNLAVCCASGSGCADYVTAPPFVETTTGSPNAATATVHLTPDGESFTTAAPGSPTQNADVELVAYVQDGQAPRTCADLLAGSGSLPGVTMASVVLRLTNEVVDGG